jgi:hypothetical protein
MDDIAMANSKTFETLKDLPRAFTLFTISLILLLASKEDSHEEGLVFFLLLFSILIFVELKIIRSTLIKVYADAITDNRFLSWILRGKFLNNVLTAFISVYLAGSLLLFSNLSDPAELVIIGFSGILLAAITPLATAIVDPIARPEPAKMFARVAAISVFVVLAILIDGAYTVWGPTNCWIQERFDPNIPDCVIAQVDHSVLYFENLLRLVHFIALNVDSIGFELPNNYQFDTARFFLALSPTPYIAYALMLLSIMSIRRIVIERKS